jgi:hypothetical protein
VVVVTKARAHSPSRERFFTSSLPDLIRQSMQRAGLLRFTALFDSLRVRMDHRVKPGGDDGQELMASSLSLLAMVSGASGRDSNTV